MQGDSANRSKVEFPEMAPSQEALWIDGPLLDVLIDVDLDTRDARREAGGSTLGPVAGQLLIDTGATVTAIDESLARRLQLVAGESDQVWTPSGDYKSTIFECSLELTGTGGQRIPRMVVMGMDFSDRPYLGVLGRDLLSLGHLSYDGRAGVWSLTL